MTIEKNVEGTTAEIRLAGWLDTSSAPDFSIVLDSLEPGIENLVLELNGLEYISSAGLRQIIVAYKKNERSYHTKKCVC